MPRPVTPALAVDCVLFDATGRLLLIERKNEPFKGGWALPGGFVDVGETVERACVRELSEETSVAIDEAMLHLVGVFSEPSRDPRGHTVAVAFAARLDGSVEPEAASDAARARFMENWRDLPLGFDHAEIVARAEAMLARDQAALR